MDSLFEPTPIVASRFVRVAVERGIETREGGRAGDGLTYAAPPLDPAEPPLAVGERVEVPLGRGDRRAAGIVVTVGGRELLGTLDPRKVKAILRRTGAALPERLVELARWMSEYYLCPLGMVLGAMMPAAVKHGTGRRTRTLVEPVPPDEAGPILKTDGLTMTARAAWEAILRLAPAELPAEARALAARVGAINAGPINRLIRLGLLREVERSEVRAGAPVWDGRPVEAAGQDAPPIPTPDQARVIDGIASTLGSFAPHLLRGVTGSGKTEVYLRLIERVRARDQSAIVLVPEIVLTPQTAGRFLRRFDTAVAVLHSGLTASERHRQWRRAADGTARVVVGARSAIFAPVQRLGLIVVDEEHDSSGYKQDQLPRYHGRDVAVKRAQIEGCPVLLASATPSLESWMNARAPRGHAKYRLWELPRRVGGAGRLPAVRVVDMIAERRERAGGPPGESGARRAIGPTLEAALLRTLGEGGQVILLLNRRGYSSYISCPDTRCAWVLACEECAAAMVLHRPGRLEFVRCHHCLAEQRLPATCPVCGRRTVALGTGTQRVEEELASILAPLGLPREEAMLRVDSDTMRSARDYFGTLARFAAGSLRVLLGTQLIAKGLDYPNVRLVGVIDADTALTIPDFRCAERTFQLVSQVAGRAGRGVAPGLVIVQTHNPAMPAIVHAAAHDYPAFADEELALRDRAGLPPVTRMARIVIRNRDRARAAGESKALADSLEASGSRGGEVRVLGPAPCPIERIAGHFRFAVEIIAPTARALHGPLDDLRRRGLLTSDAHTAVDIDPVAMT